MQDEIWVITEEVSAELTEKRSRFIAQLSPVRSEEEAISYLESIRKQYYDARHNCYAYLVGEAIQRFSDDGEPSGTAGKPILDVLLANHLTDCVLVVTRYFGGILLGAGPLARAYSQSAALAVNAAKEKGLLGSLICGRKLIVRCDYNYVGKLQYLFAQNDIVPLSTLYEEAVTFTLPVEEALLPSLKEKVKEITAASAITEDGGAIRFLRSGSKIIPYEE